MAGLVNGARGITLNVGLVRGGTRVNVVPAEAWAVVDVRVKTLKDAADLERRLKNLKPFNGACQLRIRGGVNRPPMERTPGVAALYRQARQFAHELGWNLEEASVGGGSDGNFTAGLGVPTLDGLGGVGEGAHAENESILIGELARRAALLSALVRRI
jgi:glutamate carboxypeptidase